MTKQLLEDELTVNLPAYYGHIHSPFLTAEGNRRFLVTEAKPITLRDLQTDVLVDGVTVDIQGEIGSYHLAIYLAHKGRPIPEALRECANPSTGIIAIWLDRTRVLFREVRLRDRSYRTTLIDFLENDLESKEWIYHPRYRHAKQKAEQAAAAVPKPRRKRLIAQNTTIERTAPIPQREAAPTRTPVIFECVICKSTWTSIEESASACPKCETHLYRRVKQRIHGAK